MMRFSRSHTLALRAFVLAALAAPAVSCGIEKQSAPPLAGPSEFGTSITLVADPDIIPRDGASQSRITVIGVDATGAPYAGRPISLSLAPSNAGTLSSPQVNTDSAGRAVFFLTAPAADTVVDGVTVLATPFGSNFDNATARSVRVGLLAPDAATPDFTVTPSTPERFQLTTFDASATTYAGSPCNASCTYSWTFGNEGSATGQVVGYRFQQEATYTVTLAVTSPTGITTRSQRNVLVTSATAPNPTFTVSPGNPRVGDTVFLNASGSTAANGATIVEYTWDFGNGQTGSGVTTSTTFATARTYVVRLTVRDSNGVTATVTQSVVVATP